MLYRVGAEICDSSDTLLELLQERKITDPRFEDVRSEIPDPDWTGVKTYEEALRLLTNGYQPAVKQIYEEISVKSGRPVNGRNRGYIVKTAPEGFQPVVPLAIMGLPNSMVTCVRGQNGAKVLNLFVDTTCLESTSILMMTFWGIQLMKMIYNLEMCGNKINLYVCQAFAGKAGADMLCLKVKNSNTPLDLRRISFPLCHTAFTRVIGFDWYSKFPAGVYRKSYGTVLVNAVGKDEAHRLIRTMFGPSALFVTYKELEAGGESYLRRALSIEAISKRT